MNKSAPFYSASSCLRSWMLIRPEFEPATSRMIARFSTNWAIGVYFFNDVEEFYTWHVQPVRQLACGCCSRSQVTPVPLLPRGIPYSCILPTISALPSSRAKLILREFNSTQSYATISFVSVWEKKHDGLFRILKGLCGLERNRIGFFQPIFKDTNWTIEKYTTSGGQTKTAKERSFVFVHQHGAMTSRENLLYA